MKLITSIDIEDKNVIDQIQEEMDGSKFIYITSTINIKEIRKDSFLEELIPYTTKKEDAFNLFTFGEFQKDILNWIYNKERYISTADQKFILSKLIVLTLNKQPMLANAFEEMKHELFELFNFLMFTGIKKLDNEILEQIEKEYSNIEASIFKLYNQFNSLLNDIIPKFKEYKGQDDYLIKLTKNILNELDIQESLYTIQEKLKSEIYNRISKVDKIFIDGFLFFNDLQKYVIKSAINQGKKVIIVAKYSISDDTNSFLLDDNYLKLAKELGEEIEIPYVEENVDFNTDSALNYLQMKYPEIDKRISKDIKEKFFDGSVKIIKPFSNRDDELVYIAKQISERVKNSKLTDPKEIIDFINNEIAIVLAVEKEKYEERFSQVFEEVGVFLLNKELLDELLEINCSKLPTIIYSKAEYLKIDIVDKDGHPLSFDEKFRLFKKLYHPIQIYRKPRPIASYPIGQYILQIYNIVTEGMSIEGFKMLLYSNWQYVNSHGQQKNQVERWDKYISDFKNIETYFEDFSEITDWITVIENILFIKKNIQGKKIYRWHPYNHVEEESILSIRKILKDLDIIIKSIKKINGSIVDHIDGLKSKIMKSDKILEIDDSKLNFEQKIVKKLSEAVNQIGGSSLVKGLDVDYFAENLHGMLKDWENERLEDEISSPLKINIVNLENMKKYKHVFFMMLEANKYPRKYEETFPFSKEILEILQEPKYGIMIKPSQIHGLNYHLRLEQYLFKNVLDFTTKELIITYSEKEDSNKNKPSIYIEDIASIFDLDIDEVHQSNNFSNVITQVFDKKRIKAISFERKNNYSTLELGIYLLCPKLYFHVNYENQSQYITYTNRFQLRLYAEALLYYSVLERFKLYNQTINKFYSVHENEYYFILKKLLETSTKKIINYFPFLTEYEIKDIKNRTIKKILNFVKSNVISYKKYNCFTILQSDSQIVQLKDANLNIDIDTVIKGDKGIICYQTILYLEFLALKTIYNNNQENNKIVSEIINALNSKHEEIDRINLTIRLIHNLNLGIINNKIEDKEYCQKLIDQINNTNFLEVDMMSSKFCRYCKLVEICKGHLHLSKEESYEL